MCTLLPCSNKRYVGANIILQLEFIIILLLQIADFAWPRYSFNYTLFYCYYYCYCYYAAGGCKRNFLKNFILFYREFEPIRLLSLQFLGRLLVGLPSEKKGARFFNLAVGRSRLLSENHRKISLRMQPIFSAISDRLFRFPQTENLCATLFDVLLGGASPKQVITTNDFDK